MGKGGNRQSGFRRRFFLRFAHRQTAVLHRGGKHDLRTGALAWDFLLFCQRNPKACPLLAICAMR